MIQPGEISLAHTDAGIRPVVVASLVAAILLFSMDSLAYKLMVDWLPSIWGKING
mgnify:CR=1 FL=1